MGEDKVIESGLEISIDIVMTKYEKKEYNCIGKLHGTNSDEEESN